METQDIRGDSSIYRHTVTVSPSHSSIHTQALLWYDVALTFTAEVERIWCREFTYVTVVYLIMRYTAVLERGIFVLEIMLFGIDSTVVVGSWS